MITPGHKRALNRALHELRRPLQALVLLEEGSGRLAATPPAASRRGLLELAVSALRDLDGTINGGPKRRIESASSAGRWFSPAWSGGALWRLGLAG